MRVTDTLAFVCGGWQLDRELTDHRSGTRGRFTGHALVSPAAAGLGPGEWQYTEAGILVFGAHSGPATRRLRYQERPDGTVAVRFADGRPFYVLDLRTGSGQAEHGCGPDHYLLSHRVLGAGLLAEQWRVRGPDKDYQAITRLERKPLHKGPIHRTMDVNNVT
ncbi:MAG TPA: DUF6314 family protein [Streptosporangiaceae bacterium]|nr:DUF6314 family protein [Streptosporangiaceae bacterium]